MVKIIRLLLKVTDLTCLQKAIPNKANNFSFKINNSICINDSEMLLCIHASL